MGGKMVKRSAGQKVLDKLRDDLDAKSGLTLLERRFVLEFQIDFKPKEALLRCGYTGGNAEVRASKLLARKRVADAIIREQRRTFDHLRLTKEEILLQLFYCATRTSDDFVDEAGKLRPLHEMTDRAKHCINGIEQEVVVLHDDEGKEIGEKIKTKVRLVPKEAALDMVMRHKGLFEADNAQRVDPITIQVQAVLQALDDRRNGKLVEVDVTKQLTAPVDDRDEEQPAPNPGPPD